MKDEAEDKSTRFDISRRLVCFGNALPRDRVNARARIWCLGQGRLDLFSLPVTTYHNLAINSCRVVSTT